MSNYNFVEELIQDGLVMLQTSFIGGEFAKQVPPVNMTNAQEKRYRYSLFTNAQSYQMWVNNVMSIGLDESDQIAVFGAVKGACYRFLANYRAGKFQQTTVVKQEVVVDELAARMTELEARVVELKDLAINQAEAIKAKDKTIADLTAKVEARPRRTLLINGVLTKVEVVSKVGF